MTHSIPPRAKHNVGYFLDKFLFRGLKKPAAAVSAYIMQRSLSSRAMSMVTSFFLSTGKSSIVGALLLLIFTSGTAWDKTKNNYREASQGVANRRCEGALTAKQQALCDEYDTVLDSWFYTRFISILLSDLSTDIMNYADKTMAWVSASTFGWMVWLSMLIVFVILMLKCVNWIFGLFDGITRGIRIHASEENFQRRIACLSPEMQDVLHATTPMRANRDPACEPRRVVQVGLDE